MPVQQDGGALGGGAPRVVWLTSESDPRLVSARSVAADLARESRPAHLVWNPGSGEVVQQVPIVRAARALNGRAGREGRICAQIMVVGRAREPFTAGLLAGLEEIMRWLDSWGVPRRWPAGPPLPSPQSYHSGRSRRDWARGGHYGACQVPGLSRPDPGGIDIDRITGARAPVTAVPRPRPVPEAAAADPALVEARITARRGGDPLRAPDTANPRHTPAPDFPPAKVAHVAAVVPAAMAAAGCDDVPAPAASATPPPPDAPSPDAVSPAPEPARMRS
ncbi:hypothetical protein Arub01_36640 [Actinomadura rubrobrunea]|uniref:Uncharacterized protein n=2 Tax=Actinomadura rubrobrunea TaxID=115335 RepID=A0A9W6UY72_9ACTN|nr:hypothetical protein [Actinomadura rubrobrunea]GLW65420.1 hypothetical protein Arub01_36640 [Actinomadura rubrobrunea]